MNERVLLSALVCGCVLSGAVIFLELDTGRAGERTAVTASEPQAAVLAAHPPRTGRSESFVQAILARPLFSPTRRPPAASGKADGALLDLSGTRLTGIITLPSLRIAIFAVDGKRPVALKEGDTVSGWRIEKITPTAVALRGPGGVRELAPRSDKDLQRTPLRGAFTAPARSAQPAIAAARQRPQLPPFRPPVPPFRPHAPRARPWR
jgi:hypothetical protein